MSLQHKHVVHPPPFQSLTSQDRFALNVKLRGSTECLGDLNRLAHDLLQTSTERPEPWVALALYNDVRGDREKALNLVAKALKFAPRHVIALQLKVRCDLFCGITLRDLAGI